MSHQAKKQKLSPGPPSSPQTLPELPQLLLPPIPPAGGWLLCPPKLTNSLKQSLKASHHICQTTPITRFNATTNKPPKGYTGWPDSPATLTSLCAIPLNPNGTLHFTTHPTLLPPLTTLVTEMPATPPTTHTATFVDLFAGIGGFRAGLEASGNFKCSLSSELSTECRVVYSKNFAGDTDPAAVNTDVTRLPASVIAELAPSIICGGFPCQSFSSHGEREGFANVMTGGLFMHVVRLVAAARPKVVVLENVRGLMNHDHGRTMDVVVRSLEKLGYCVKFELMDGSLLLPQIRRRVFIVAFSSASAAARFNFPTVPPLYRTLRSELEEATTNDFVHLTDAQWSKITKGAYYQDRPGARLADLDEPGRTLCSRYKKGWAMYSQFVPVSEANPRFLSIRECCRLQGFPESFVLPEGFGPRNEFYGMIGNAVPVPMVCAVGLAVEKALGIGGGEGVLLRVLKEAARDPEAVERAWVKGWPKIVSDASCVLKARGEAEADVNT